ncbi:MAG: acyltransferase family protein [Victivallaceae bacterium]|nr:acyltransferase family protein [Victivallaceae bacterium]
MKRRIEFDILRGIGIIAVVLGHCSIGNNVVYMFHIPLFIFVSGMLAGRCDKQNKAITQGADATAEFWRNLRKRTARLYVPFVMFQLFFLMFHNLLVKYHLYSSETLSWCGFFKNVLRILTMGGGESLGGALWFLICLFEISVLWEVLRFLRQYVSDSFFQAGIAVFSILLYCVGANFYFPRSLNISFTLFIYYVMGWFCTYHSIGKRFRKRELRWSIFLAASVLLFLGAEKGISYNDMKNPNAALAVATAGIVCAVMLTKKIRRSSFFTKIFRVCGVYSFSIMALHFAIFKAITAGGYFLRHDASSLAELCPPATLDWKIRILYAVCGVAFPIALSYCFFYAGRFFPGVMRCLTGQWLCPQKR